ncbi:protein translocase subunit SecD [Methylopila jiangsuensis]|uniref:Protein translocase subunit SecD n=1 Tax=Methylopila jiangsuensis TaxID=586230 RepID=A0A9W6N3C5_9HYPH|nr:protein translocase subunit SecD [Methylopila jiangsuensis]MDR6286167.1 protein-export membrane protein SecD [Methylopila jiangsuensis]GLK75927.1 protein translocase subunit SecD [Methylopila jiangsuensis]
MLHFSFWKTAAVLALCALGVLFALPNVLPQSVRDAYPSWFPARTIVLGLDLQGGSQLLLEVDGEALTRSRAVALQEDVRRQMREARIGTSEIRLDGRAVSVTVRDAADLAKAQERLRTLAQPITNTVFGATGQLDLEVGQRGANVATVSMTDAGVQARIRQAVDQSLEVVRRRVDQLGTVEPSIQRQGANRILVQVPGLGDPEHLKRILGQTAKLEFRLVSEDTPIEQALQGALPAGTELLYEGGSAEQGGRPLVIERRAIISGDELTDAQPGFEQNTREPVVSFRFNNRGAQAFADVTRQNVGKRFAIVLDDKVISAPTIREVIPNGQGQISGSFTVQSANDLAVLLRAGALPAPLNVIEERVVGPGLGQDSIEAGTRATWVAAVFVVIFMFATYGVFGFFANVALTVHVVFIFALMSLLGATLTLPGIAGIVLTIGTAVDSNVLIYERIREEFRAGRSMVSAIEAGFKHAFAVIVDSNSTMGIAALILFALGSGPVRGFAVVFLLGILTTVITAVTMTRMMIALWYRRTRPTTMPF